MVVTILVMYGEITLDCVKCMEVVNDLFDHISFQSKDLELDNNLFC